MKYQYKSVTGNNEIEVNDDWSRVLLDLDNEETNSDRKHSRRNPVSLEGAEYEGEWFADGTDLLADLIEAESLERLRAALAQLTPAQRELVEQVYFNGIPPSEIARRGGVDKSAISHRLELIYKKLKNILK